MSLKNDNPFSESSMNWLQAIVEAKEEFPLSFDEIKQATAQQYGSWHHPLVGISHALLDHYKIVDDPFMLSSLEEKEGGYSQTGCHCFYATISYNDLGIFVFDNWGEGNMCKEIPENLRAVLPYPEWLKPHMETFRSIVREMIEAEAPMQEFNPPRAGYAWPEIASAPKVVASAKSISNDEQMAP